MKKKYVWRPRLPQAVIDTLRHRGGAHGSKKGGKGYERSKEKARAR
jgi:hypothetical protein